METNRDLCGQGLIPGLSAWPWPILHGGVEVPAVPTLDLTAPAKMSSSSGGSPGTGSNSCFFLLLLQLPLVVPGAGGSRAGAAKTPITPCTGWARARAVHSAWGSGSICVCLHMVGAHGGGSWKELLLPLGH